MELGTYRKKRDFDATPEPRGVRSRSVGWSYAIQKHAARRLHFDFRLELDGVLLSWAVPKGPSLDPSLKRLAVQTEDHPIEYGDFEGTIPEGEYGGGTVMLWDRGTWSVEGGARAARAAYAKGHLTFELHGTRLHGRWHLVRSHRRGARDEGRSWLLFKGRDDASASAEEPTLTLKRSVATERTMEEIRAAGGRVWRSKRGQRGHAPIAHAPELPPQRLAAPPQRAAAVPTHAPGAESELARLVTRLSHHVRFSHLDKVLFPEAHVTKAALIAHYAIVAP